MENIYYDPAHPGGFSSIAKLAKASGYSLKVVKEWLLSQDTYTLHKLARKKFPRNRYLVDNIDDLWEIDLTFLRSLAKHNDNYNYLLCVIDVFSKKAWVEPLKNKRNSDVIKAFENIFASGRKPREVQSDKGGEFLGREAQTFFRENGINYHTTRNPDVKAAIIERFQRTLKNRMWRYLTYKNSYRYIDVLQDMVRAYNNSVHSSIGMAPNDVNETNILQVWRNLYPSTQTKIRPKLKVGTYVRISRKKGIFEKGYETYFTDEIFKIIRVARHPVPVYEIQDLNGEVIDGLFYEYELQPVIIDKNKSYKIDKILGRRKKKGISEVLVSWVGYSPKFNQWIPAKDLVKLKK